MILRPCSVYLCRTLVYFPHHRTRSMVICRQNMSIRLLVTRSWVAEEKHYTFAPLSILRKPKTCPSLRLTRDCLRGSEVRPTCLLRMAAPSCHSHSLDANGVFRRTARRCKNSRMFEVLGFMPSAAVPFGGSTSKLSCKKSSNASRTELIEARAWLSGFLRGHMP